MLPSTIAPPISGQPPDSTDWNGASAVTDDVDVVDGLWEISGNNVKTTEIGFDRLLAIGDMDTWTEYEITVPVTVRSILLDPKIPGNGAGVGLIIRWKGHFDVDGQQPRLGWRRLGALGWYRWDLKGMAGLEMRGHEGKFIGTSTTRELEFDTRYIFKLSVQSSPEPDKNAYYRLKFWPSSEPEPAKWGIEGFGKDGELTSGSMLLVANNADVTFGNATVVPLSDISSTLNTSVASTDSVGAGILGQNPDGKTTFAYGERVVLIPVPDEGSEFAGWSGDYTGIGTGSDNRLVIFMTKNINVTANFAKGTPKTLTVNVLGDGTVVKSPDKSEYAKDELVELTAVPGPGQALASWSGDIEGNINPITVLMNSNKTITANFDVAEVVPPPLSDDFNACTLNTELWSFQNPLDDGDYTTDGTQATLIVPEGVKHDPWSGSGSSRTNNAIRIMQDADNSDFVIETKLTSQLDGESANQIVGILVEDDTDTFLRFDLYTDGAISDPDLKSFIGYLDNGAPAVKKSGRDDDFDGMPSYSALYLRVERVGDNWTFSYRFDDGAWVVVKTVTQVLAAKKVGVFAGNATLSPELIAVFDYFFNTAAPTTPEDAKGYELVVNTEGQGTVAKSPDNGAYACGEEVTLTATPANGWKFAGWSGAINGLTNPQDLALDMGTIVNARFEEDGAPGEEYTLAVQTVGGGSVVKSPNKPSYQSGDKVTLTATANSGWRFVSWSGGISGAINPYVLEITTNTTVVAAFEQESTTPDQYTLIATTNGAGTVSMVPEKPTYNSGEKVQLTATPAEGWVFNGWTGDLPTGVDNQLPTIQVTMSQDRTLTAHFKGESSDMDIYLPFITKK